MTNLVSKHTSQSAYDNRNIFTQIYEAKTQMFKLFTENEAFTADLSLPTPFSKNLGISMFKKCNPDSGF